MHRTRPYLVLLLLFLVSTMVVPTLCFGAGRLAVAVFSFLNRCMERKLPPSAHMDKFAESCHDLKNDLGIRKNHMRVMNIHTALRAHRQLAGEMDLSRFFDGASGLWNFETGTRNGKIVIVAARGAASPVLVPMRELVKMSDSSTLTSESIQQAIKTLDLGTIFSITRIEFGVDSSEFFMTGTYLQDGVMVPVTIVFEKDGKLGMIVPDAKKLFNRLQARVFGFASVALAPFVLSSVQVSLATSLIGSSETLVSVDPMHHSELKPGLQVDVTASFNSKSTNPLFAFWGRTGTPFSFSFILNKPEIVTEFSLQDQEISEQLRFVGTNFKLKPNLAFTHVAIVFSSTVEYNIDPRTTIHFASKVSILPGTESMDLPLRLMNAWTAAFGIKKMIIPENIVGSFQLALLPRLLAFIQLNGDVSIGTIKGVINAHLDGKSILNNYFLMQVAILTFSEILTQFFELYEWKLPLAIQTTVFKDLKLSFAFVAIPELNIPAGLGVNGAGNILGLPCTLSVGVTSNVFDFSARILPVNIGGFSLTSINDPTKGPLIKFSSGVGAPINLQVSANVNSFFFASAATLKFDSEGISFSSATSVFNEDAVVHASITASSYGFTATFAATPPLLQAVVGFLKKLVEENGITDDYTKIVVSYADDFSFCVTGDLRSSDTKSLTFTATFKGQTYTVTAVASVVDVVKNVALILSKIKDVLIVGLKSWADSLNIRKNKPKKF